MDVADPDGRVVLVGTPAGTKITLPGSRLSVWRQLAVVNTSTEMP